MQKKFTLHTRNIVGLICLMVLGLVSTNLTAQKWSGANGNEWLVSGKKYAKIAVKAKGIHQVDLSSITDTEVLPAGFNPANLQLWHRGVQIPLLSASASAITFYGEPNDGKFDELLMRPYYNKPEITSRMNKFVSLFSDNGMYFLTVGTSAGLRAAEIDADGIANIPVTAEAYHMKTDTIANKNDFSHSNAIFIYPQYMNSFYEYGKTLTGLKVNPSFASSTNAFNVSRINAAVASIPPKVKFLLHNRGNSTISVKVQVAAKTGGSPRTVTILTIDPFSPLEYEFSLQLDNSFIGDIDVNGDGNLIFSMDSPNANDRYSVSYYTVTYPQNFDVQSKPFFIFNLPASLITGPARVSLSAIPAGTTRLLDITNVEAPKIITTATPSSFGIPRVTGQPIDLLVASVTHSVSASQISYYKAASTTYDDYKSYDYFIIVADDQNMINSAGLYANYRAGTKKASTGQNFKPLVLNISDIYNQYNYGEPSAVAIRRCIDFLISDGNVDKYLLLIGNSTTYLLGTRELVNEVPSIGYPGSDNLLVTGLGVGSHIDIPSIPIGRIPTSDYTKVDAYLQKVKEYEDFSNPVGQAWRRNVVHVNGGKDINEVNSFASTLAGTPTSKVTASTFGGVVTAFSKDPENACPDPVEVGFTDCQTWANTGVATQVNSGAGVLTYYGHGNPRVTDYFYGYVSDPGRNYANNKKYSALFLYGCDVNNVFRGFNENVTYALTSTSKRPFTVDWLLTPEKGAITVVGNTWEGYESILTPYLDKTYTKLFTTDGARKPLGRILKDATAETINALGTIVPNIPTYNYNYIEANVLQTMLLGDPAMTILLKADPLPVDLVSFDAKYQNDNQVKVEWVTASEKNNGHFNIERSYNAKNFETIGFIEGKGDILETSSYVFYDNQPLEGINYYRLVQVDKDENGTVNEGKKTYSRIVAVKMPNSTNFAVSPNPSPANFQIELKGTMELGSWNLINIQGRVIKSNGKSSIVDMSNYPSGEYILEIITTNNDVMRKKVIKQ